MQGFCVLNTGVMSCWSVVCRYGYKKKAKNGLLTKGTLRLEAAFIGLAFVAMVLQNSFEQPKHGLFLLVVMKRRGLILVATQTTEWGRAPFKGNNVEVVALE